MRAGMGLWQALLATIFFLFPLAAFAVQEEDLVIVEKNIFSPERKYVPASPEEGRGGSVSAEELSKNLVLRGTFSSGGRKWAVLEVKGRFKSQWGLKDTVVIVPEGETLGPCRLQEVEEGRVRFGPSCGEATVAVADNPERRRPLPKRPSSLPKRPSPPNRASQKTQKGQVPRPPGKIENPFLKFKKQHGGRS